MYHIYLLILFQLGISITSTLAQTYTLPQPQFEVLQPSGLRISIPDAPGLQLFAFHGNINKQISSGSPGEISGGVFRAKNGQWTLNVSNVVVQEGDVINYWIYVQANGGSFVKDNQSYRIRGTDNEENSTPAPNTDQGQLIFSEDFNTLDKSLWSYDIKMPLGPDYEFCVYHTDNHPQLVTIDNGILRIRPIILEDSYGENATAYGKMTLANCTSIILEECTRHAMSYSILPPVISARLNTKNRFSLKYGKIEIRAKFPEGDWLYPELWLEPRFSLYGPKYASGRVILGLARGNDNLVNAQDLSQIFDGRKLEFGIKSGFPTIREENVQKIVDRDAQWNKDFHVYTTIWTAGGFKFLADGEEIGRLLPTANGWLHNTDVPGMTPISPFDQEFYLSIGVGAGGVRVFPDKTISSGYEKPWKNVGAKPMLRFWHSKDQWLPSWRKENGRKTALEIDYIKSPVARQRLCAFNVYSLQMTSIRNIFAIVLILILSGNSSGVALHRLKRSQNDYILHRCIASAELIKAHVVERSPAQSISSDIRKEDTNQVNAYYDTTMVQQNNKKIKMHDDVQEHYTLTDSKDTPLKTVNIEAIQKNRPLIFQKKYPLPELQRNVSSGLSEMSTNVIIIKPSS
ncbi:hypothetical protein KPH14_010017 [Odynerus spinipes]|uniref:Beta-1,3-glucan-binding protein n=1 Tax=Odynerus spinipes TaxID=1348599 RepID=A0AAD9RU80_9HYME|nr:hypothetical protein KPH14_010017 [Odynerus spinipes]